jgi:hypothetical protein
MKIFDRFVRECIEGFVPDGATPEQCNSKLRDVGVAIGILLAGIVFIVSTILGWKAGGANL